MYFTNYHPHRHSKAGHRSTLRSYVFAFWYRASVYVRLSAFLRGDESSTCVCLRLREQCLRSEITSVARVAHVLLLSFIASNMDVNTLASKRSELIRIHSDCSKALRNLQQVDLCVLASFSCRVYAETQGRKVRPVAGLRHCWFRVSLSYDPLLCMLRTRHPEVMCQ